MKLLIFSIISMFVFSSNVLAVVHDTNIGNEYDILVHSGDMRGNNNMGTWKDPSSIISGSEFNYRYTEGSENRLENYGYFDYLPEVGAKNSLILQGYSKIYDFENETDNPLTAIEYYGWQDKINKLHTDYVLTEEWEAYSAQSQDKRIIDNKNELTRVNDRHTKWNQKQDSNIDHLNNRVDDLDSRVDDLEETQYIIGGRIRILDTKNWNVELFADYSTNRNKIDRTGITFTYKLGESYSDRKIRILEKRLDKLENNNLK